MNKPEYKSLTKERIRTETLYAVLLAEITNGYGTLSKGTRVRLTGKHNSTFSVVSLPCARCKVKLDFTKVPYQIVELINFDPTEIPALPGEIDYLVNQVEMLGGGFSPTNKAEISKLIRSFIEKEIGRFASAIDTTRNGSAPDGGLTRDEGIAAYYAIDKTANYRTVKK